VLPELGDDASAAVRQVWDETLAELESAGTATGPAPQHLYEISKAPRDTWRVLVGALGAHGWTVADTSRKVGTVNTRGNFPGVF